MNARSYNILLAILFATTSIFLLGNLKGIPVEGRIFPSFLLYSILFCSLLMILHSFQKSLKKDKVVIFSEVPWLLWFVVIGIFVFYMVGMFYLGFYFTTFVASMGVVTAMSIKEWKKKLMQNLLFSLGLSFSLYLFFSLLMHVPFPDGVLF